MAYKKIPLKQRYGRGRFVSLPSQTLASSLGFAPGNRKLGAARRGQVGCSRLHGSGGRRLLPRAPRTRGSPAGNPTNSQSYKLRAASCLEAIREGCRSSSPFSLPALGRQRWPATNPGRPREPRRQVCKLQPPLLLPPPRSYGVPRETPKKTPKQNPQTCTFISFWLQHTHAFISKDESSLRVYYRVFLPTGGWYTLQKLCFKSHKSDVFCCCPVFSALITPKVSC